MLYEGSLEIHDEVTNITLIPENPDTSSYDIQLSNDDSDIKNTLEVLQPCFAPDEEPEEISSYIQNVIKSKKGNFYTDSLNVQDLKRIYTNSEKPSIPAFPGIPAPPSKGEVVFTERCPKFTGIINEQYVTNKDIEITIRRKI